MSFDTLLYEIRGHAALVTFNRPEKLNTWNATVAAELSQALQDAEADDAVRAIVLTGAGRAFCAGQDLADGGFTEGDVDLGVTLEQHYNPLIRLGAGREKPIICAVNGVAAGAGANLALACDIVLAARSAKFIQAFCKIGLIPDSGGTWFLPRLVGEARARALMLTGEKVSAEQAEAWGMIWQCVDDDALRERADALSRDLASAPTRGLALTRKSLLASNDNSLDQQLDLERDLQREAGNTADFREGVSAFVEKRAPEFTGR